MPRPNKVYQAPNCTWVVLQSSGQSYRLSISNTLFVDNRRRYISLLGCRHDEHGLRKAHQYQLTVQDEISNGTFDSTLQKYQCWKDRAIYEPIEVFTLGRLWSWWLEVKRPLISESTYQSKYKGILLASIHKIGSSEKLNTATADKLFDYVVTNVNKHDAIKLFNELEKACNRAIQLNLVTIVNPFIGYRDKLVVLNKAVVSTDSVSELMAKHNGKVAYTAIERDRIIEWFIINRPHYAKYIFFKFYTGCRFGESVELRWKDVSTDCKTIFFRRSYVENIDLVKTTKTNQERRFNCSSELTEVLLSIRKHKTSFSDDIVIFKSDARTRIRKSTLSGMWNKAIFELAANGVIEGKLSQNHTRHTFNSIARLSNDREEVAVQLGHSAKTADLHYTNRASDTKVLVLE